MPEQISVSSFIAQTWEDYKSPPTSTFDKKMSLCRNTVSAIEEDLDTDRSELTKLKKSVRALYNSTNKHAQNEADIAENLDRIGRMTRHQQMEINAAFHDFAKVTKDLSTLIEDLSKSLHNNLQYPLESFLKGDIKEVKGDLRKPFDKAWRDYESKFSKLEKDAKKKANEAGLYRAELSGGEVAEEMEKERKIFQLQFCIYLIKVNEMKTKKGVDLLQSLIGYYRAVKLFFEQGQSTLEEHQSVVDGLSQQLKDIKEAQNQERGKLTELQAALKNSMAGYKEPSCTVATPAGYSLHQLQGNKNHGIEKEGYLLKKSEGMLKKVWQKRKCTIKDGTMSISHSDETKSPVKLNLLTCQVKLVADDPGKKCFDLVSSHGNRTYHFQADDEKELEKWISVTSNAKEDLLLKAFQESSSSPTINTYVRELATSIIETIRRMPGNQFCCDCGSPDPQWLSTNLGVLICLECVGFHRKVGVHISRTQSIVIDQLSTSQLLLARLMGNDNFNEVLEAKLDSAQKPKPDSPMSEREVFITSKYTQHKFTIQTCDNNTELQLQDLQQAIQTRDIQALLQVYAEGLDLMTPLPDSPVDETGLHLAIAEAIAEEDGTSLPIVDFIVQNSNLNSLGRQTREGNTPLHICAQMNKSECMKCILRVNADVAHIKNNAGLTALDIASDKNYQLCAELLKAAMAGKKDVFEHVNIEWDLISDDHMDGLDFSDDDDGAQDRKPRSRPSSIVGVENPRREGSTRDRMDSDPSTSNRHMPGSKPRKHHHLTHPTRVRNSLRMIPGLSINLNSFPDKLSQLSQSLPITAVLPSRVPKKPILPPRGVRPPGPIPGVSHVRNVSDPESNTFVFDHRRTPSEPPLRSVADASNRKTVAIPNYRLSPVDTDKPIIPPRPRALSSTEDNRTPDRDIASTRHPDTPPPIPIPRKPLPKKKRCQALFDCDADNEDELTFREGEVIVLLREEEEEWWEGEVEGQSQRHGLFPLSFVKMLPD